MSNFTRPTLPIKGNSFVRRLLPAILLAPVALFLSAWSYQDGEEKVTIKGNGVPLLTVFKTIKKQAGYNFFYAANFVNDKEKVNVDVKNERVEDVLQKVLGSDYTWVYNENAVSITKKKEEIKRSNHIIADPDSSVTQITVSGLVTDAKGAPIPGATVMVKGTKDGASTDAEGKFSLPGVATNATLVISSVGFEKRELAVKGKTILAKLNVSVNDLDEAVVVAYNTTTQRRNVGAVTVVKGAQIQSLPERSIDRALQGLVPGLQITPGSGVPGGSVANITLRGTATGGVGIARNPLYVLDGTPITQENFNGISYVDTRNTAEPTNPLSQINPNDIESISVLKDAAAIALYGSRASNGVILITTKKGKAGKLAVNFRHQTDVSQPVEANHDVLNQDQYLDLLYESYKNADPSWTDQTIFNDLIAKFPYRIINGDTSFYPASDWRSALYRKAAVSVSNDLSFSGGSDKSTYYLGIGYLTQDGILKNTGFDRASLRYNISMRPASWLNIGINTSLAYTSQNYGSLNDFITEPTGFAYYVSPLFPIRQQNGDYNYFYPHGAYGDLVPNPVAAMEYNKNTANSYRGTGNAFAEIRFLRHFSFRTNLGIDFLTAKNINKIDKRVDRSSLTGVGGNLFELDDIRSILLSNNILKYSQTFGKHSIELTAAHEAQIIKSSILKAEAYGFTSGFTDDEIASGNSRSATGSRSKATFLSYFGQATYDFRQRYLLSASLRLDGSSRFGSNVPLNKFWSLGAGWVASEERFFKRLTPTLTYFKIRGSIGIAGNTIAIPPDTRSNTVSGVYMTSNPPTLPSAVLLTPGNPDVKSESTFNTDIGIETRLFQERVSISVDYYKRRTYDMVTSVPTAFLTGIPSMFVNLGDIENKGLEISFSVDVIQHKDFKWNISANWSKNSNKLVKAYAPDTYPTGYSAKMVNRVGQSYNSWYLVRWAGVDPTDGSPQWFDKDGKITKEYNANENSVQVGKPQPDGFGAINTSWRFRNIELSVFLYYAYGYKVYNSFLEAMLDDGASPSYFNQSVLALNRWQKPGDMAANPKRVLDNPIWYSNSPSTRYLVDGDYVRLKNIMITYHLSDRISKLTHIAGAKLFLQINNLAFWSKSDNLDPDNTGTFGESGTAYPQQRSFSLGFNLSF